MNKTIKHYLQQTSKDNLLKDWEEANKKEDEVDMCPQDIWGWFKYLRYMYAEKRDVIAEEIYVIAIEIASAYKPMLPGSSPIINFFDLQEKVKKQLTSERQAKCLPQIDWNKYCFVI